MSLNLLFYQHNDASTAAVRTQPQGQGLEMGGRAILMKYFPIYESVATHQCVHSKSNVVDDPIQAVASLTSF